MEITFRHYTNELKFNEDYFKVYNFLKKYGTKGVNQNWHWARWEWLIGHANLEVSMLPIIGIWENSDGVVGIATHDMRIGKAYIVCNPEFKYLKLDMLKYAESSLSLNGILKLAVNISDFGLLELLQENDYNEIEETEVILSLDYSNRRLEYLLPEGFTVSCFAENRDINSLVRVIRKGFGYVSEPPLVDETQIRHRPHFNPFLTVFTLAPDGEYASHCGTWFDPDTECAYIEPVVTLPKYRRLGLGKAAVYEAVNRCSEMGAKSAIVISDQPFYHSIGFEKSAVYGFWQKEVNQ